VQYKGVQAVNEHRKQLTTNTIAQAAFE
jgi:hypothetical protein